MSRLIRYSAIGLTLIFILGFQQTKPLTDEEIITRGVEIKVEEFKKKQLQRCRDKALKVAITQADSLIRVHARQQAVEPIEKPPKPERPEKPVIKLLPDSLDHDSLRKQQ